MNRYCYALLFLLSLFFIAPAIAQTTGTVKGKITTSDGKPAADVSVSLNNGSGAVANTRGQYEIRNIAPGTYKVLVSFTGLASQEQPVTIIAGENAVVNFVLTENEKELQTVVISSRRDKQASEYAAKMPLKNMENPQVYNTVSAELLNQQAITSYDDALKNVPGIFRLWESTGRGGDGGSYFTLRGFESQVTMVNGLPGLTNGNLDPANLEKIEVLKGPSGTLFGSPVIGYGGLVNNVTKKPYDTFGATFNYIGGSFGLNRLTADVNLPFTKEKGTAVRINTAYQQENSFQDQGFRKSFFFAPTLAYRFNEKLSFLLVTEFMQEEKTNPMMLFLGRDAPLQFKDLNELNFNNKLSFTSNDLPMKNPRFNLQGQMIYKLSHNWSSQTVLSRGQSESKGYYSYVYDNENGRKDFGVFATKENARTTTTDIQQNFTGDFYIGSMRNRIVIGLDYFGREQSASGTGWGKIHNVTAQGAVNYTDIDPETGEEIPLPEVYLTQQSVDQMLAGTGATSFRSKDNAYSSYFSNILNITRNLMAMVSLRADYFDSKGNPADKSDDYHQWALSPKFGLVYQPLPDKIALFGNYMNGFRNIASSQVNDAEGKPVPGEVRVFKPEHANQVEFGIKTNFGGDKFTSTISYYDIRVDDQVLPDPVNTFNSIQGGSTRSRGLELDISAAPFTGFSVTAGYSYNDSKILKGREGDVWLEEGRRPFWAGPANLVNLWAVYKISSGTAKGLGFGLGGNYAGENRILNNTAVGVFSLPAYTVLNGSVFYDADQFRVGFNVNNFTNKEYYGGGWSTVNPQKPRNVAVSLTYKL
ncbi:TonB-dependent receptor [Niabella pedocola]|uniref:TonB-dependent receptor n=1 Tax=Niabella pedocola TaxID=1752077 RepID=A0ABS8PV18_9BACT|nr:TonB-dependent receptor [Niabella pedocola]MCD2424133.1 TonB-dependent receptor [Niabella pedocola]